VHFGEQRAAPYSMIGDRQRRYTVDNNARGTHNLLSAIVEIDPAIHLVHLGTMGVYGYSKEFGRIPEGYLDVTINSTGAETDILYPANPGSIYHMTKCLDQLLFAFYTKNWGLRITDLHQGIVWGTETPLTVTDPRLTNRFDYDGEYGTVLNRFLVQAAIGYPLTVYGTGGQTRAFINIRDTAQCVRIACENPSRDDRRVRIFNQVAETFGVAELAARVAELFDVEVRPIENPRKELPSNELEVENDGLLSLGFDPLLLTDGLLTEVEETVGKYRSRIREDVILSRARW
jgi:UDP-sulfoquinovose synthase